MKNSKILIVEDDAEISRLMAMYLEAEGFATQVIDDGAKAIDAIKGYSPNLVILDLMLPGLSGIEVCKNARKFYQGPLLVLTACDDDMSEVSLLKQGADDFLTKPLRPHVLVARIQALLRRVPNHKDNVSEPSQRKLKINRLTRTVEYNGIAIILTDAEYEMLLILERYLGVPVSREDCCKALRGIDYDFSDRSIDMRISGLRKKLGDVKTPYKIITTVRNRGYMLIDG